MRSLAEHLSAPSLTPVTDDPGAFDSCSGGSCGSLVRIFLSVDNRGVITHATARVRGRQVALAAASALTEQVVGCEVLDAARVGISTIHADFAALSGADREAALVAEDALHGALGQWVVRRMRNTNPTGPGLVRADHSMLVAMSGGVDSAVAVHDCHDLVNGSVVGVTLRLWIDPRSPDPELACCAPASVRRARETCHRICVPHLTLDLRSRFVDQVVGPFIDTYRQGMTPNPCVRCNGSFRLDELVTCADALGIETVATGHYARVDRSAPMPRLRMGVDASKDQSYMLATTKSAVLDRLAFPLGAVTKDSVRARARALGLVQAELAESQEICFLGGGDYRSFLSRAGALGPPGAIVDVDGRTIGRHEGIAAFTPGQRRGIPQLDVARGTEPLYVIATDAVSGSVTVGFRSDLYVTSVALEDMRHSWPGDLPICRPVYARLRHGGRLATGNVECMTGRKAVLELDEPVARPAPGQLACLYDDVGVVVGSAVVSRAGQDGYSWQGPHGHGERAARAVATEGE